MSNLKQEIDSMTPEQVSHELAITQTQFNWERIKRILLYFVMVAGLGYVAFGM